MRVVAGTARGRRLRTPPGRSVRPTGDRVREAVFDILGSLGGVEGAGVADLFAGTGALGIEALSRGARSATFVERDPTALRIVASNLEATGLAERATVVRADVLAWLRSAPRFDLVLADPPYDFDRWDDLLGHLRCGIAVLESDRDLDLGAGFTVVRRRRYGATVVTVAEPAARTEENGRA